LSIIRNSLPNVKKINIPDHIIGLTDTVLSSRNKSGTNEQVHKETYKWWMALFELFKEPMLVLLIAVAIIYFVLGQNDEAYFMLAAIVAVSGISLSRQSKSKST
jgi:Ca2+-transporting ATPase